MDRLPGADRGISRLDAKLTSALAAFCCTGDEDPDLDLFALMLIHMVIKQTCKGLYIAMYIHEVLCCLSQDVPCRHHSLCAATKVAYSVHGDACCNKKLPMLWIWEA